MPVESESWIGVQGLDAVLYGAKHHGVVLGYRSLTRRHDMGSYIECTENAIRKLAGRGHEITTGGLFTQFHILAQHREAEAKKVEVEAEKKAKEAE